MTLPPVGPSIGAAAPAPAAPARFGAHLRAHAMPARPPAPVPALRATLVGVDQARRHLDGVLSAARAGRTFSPQELLALQADAYRYSQTVDLAARLVEQGAQTVRQAVNTQV